MNQIQQSIRLKKIRPSFVDLLNSTLLIREQLFCKSFCLERGKWELTPVGRSLMHATTLQTKKCFEWPEQQYHRGERTVGIVTKCGALQDGDEPGVSGSTLQKSCLTSVGPENRPELRGKIEPRMVCCQESVHDGNPGRCYNEAAPCE